MGKWAADRGVPDGSMPSRHKGRWWAGGCVAGWLADWRAMPFYGKSEVPARAGLNPDSHLPFSSTPTKIYHFSRTLNPIFLHSLIRFEEEDYISPKWATQSLHDIVCLCNVWT